jgi:hypothetical protein
VECHHATSTLLKSATAPPRFLALATRRQVPAALDAATASRACCLGTTLLPYCHVDPPCGMRVTATWPPPLGISPPHLLDKRKRQGFNTAFPSHVAGAAPRLLMPPLPLYPLSPTRYVHRCCASTRTITHMRHCHAHVPAPSLPILPSCKRL